MTIDVVLFDFDGTLADTLPLTFTAFKTVFKAYEGRDVSNEELISMFGPTEEQIIENNFENKDLVLQAITDYYLIYKKGHDDRVQNDKAILELLEYLRVRGIKIGVITGKSELAFQISSESLNLFSYFDVAVTGDDVDKPKPDPEGIFKALDMLGADKSKAVFVGDSNADIMAGMYAGIRTYGVQWLSTYQSLEFESLPDLIFKSVPEFLELLKKENEG
jgi:pyrophosphatase PpaX